MMKRLVVSLALAALASIGLQPALSASAHRAETADTTVKIRLSHRPADLNADGTVSVVGWLTCSSNLYTFEYSVDVTQVTGKGSQFLSGAYLPCDGTRHRFVIRVAPYEGTFTRGPADIGIYIGLYDAANDADLAVYDSVSTRIR